MKEIAWLAVVFGVLGSPGRAVAQDASPEEERLRAIVEERRAAWNAPGLAYGVVRGDELPITGGLFGTMAVLAYDLSPEGTASFRSVLVRYDAEAGEGPDGMAVDDEGNLWVAIFSRTARTGVAVYSPAGEELAFIPTPEPTKNLAFGRGAEQRTLYITAGRSLYRIPVSKAGYRIPGRRT